MWGYPACWRTGRAEGHGESTDSRPAPQGGVPVGGMPHPGINIPSWWMDLPDEKQFVYCICCRKVLVLMFYLQISVFEACLHGHKFLTQEQLGVELICGPGSWKWHGIYGSAPAI